MKRKVILLISVLLVVVLSLSVLTACKDKDAKEEEQQEQVIPPYEWLDAITDSMEYNLLSAGNGSLTMQKRAD